MKYGKLLTFEGIDNCGKSTQAQLLYDRLVDLSKTVLSLRDPGATCISEQIRNILLDNNHSEMSAWTELLLYEAARAQMIEELIKPALNSGTFVICDRLYDSTTAYQGYARGLDLELVSQANRLGACGIVPDLTFLIDLEPQIALQRTQHREEKADRLESEGIEFQEKVKRGYLEIANNESERIIILDGSKPVKDIHHEIWGHIYNRFFKQECI